MAGKNRNSVCPVELAGGLDTRMRRLLENPRKKLGPYIKEGMVVADIGCGPGFFSIDMARMVGKNGRVIAADMQEGMLQIIRDKIRGTEIEKRVTLHKSEQNRIGITGPVDFVLLFYMVHEVPHKGPFFSEITDTLKQGGLVLIVEPPFHVSKKAVLKKV